jgi:riboflavin kinase/FMN adenylyltransferase
VKDFLVSKFQPHTVIIGYDHRFGRDRTGDYRLLEKLSPRYAFALEEIPKHIVNEISISSTNIREAILHGDFDTANKLLGYSFFFSGEVVEGDKLGRQLGYPTANLRIPDPEKITPGDGIYAVYAQLNNAKNMMKGMMSIGFRPTVDGKKRVIEVNLFDFNEYIYGQELKVHVHKFLRPEVKFPNLDALVDQIGKDKIESLKVL